jgi:hypothetical protein
MPTSPGAPDEAWSTPARVPGPVVSPSVATHEVSPGGQHIAFPGDSDPGGRDIVADSVAGSVAATEARYHELQGDTYGQGSHIGDLMDLPPGHQRYVQAHRFTRRRWFWPGWLTCSGS